MKYVTFLEDFDYTPSADPSITWAYTAGGPIGVPDECADQAIDLGYAVEATEEELDPFHHSDGEEGDE